MKQPTFFEGVAIALAAGLIGSMLYAALTSVFPSTMVLRLLIAGIGFGYIIYLLSRSRERVGRVSVVAAWILLAGVTWYLELPLMLYLLLHLLAIWLVRSLYFHASLVTSLVDLGLNGLSLAAAIWALSQTASLFLAIWSFFLTQAVFVAIPPRINSRKEISDHGPVAGDGFDRAYRNAQAALNRLASIQ